MRIAVTGGNGHLGRALTPYLLAQGHQVVSIDRALPAAFPPLTGQRPTYLVADTRDYGEFIGSLRECDALIHLAAHRSPRNHPDTTVYADNTVGSYNALSAAATLGIERVCLASSINVIGGAFSRAPRYDYFPVDEGHPTYAEDPYSLSKWVLEQQADAFVRRYEHMRVASLRFHGIVESFDQAASPPPFLTEQVVRHLWGYTLLSESCRACLLAVTADFSGHEAFYIVGPRTISETPSRELAAQHYPETPIRGELSGTQSFFDCSKAEQVLGWRHE